jgi:hypothetical protein
VEGDDVREAGFGLHGGGDRAVRRADCDGHIAAVEHGEGVFEADAELPDDRRMVELLVVLLLGEMLVAQAAPVVADHPGAVIGCGDVRWGAAGEDRNPNNATDQARPAWPGSNCHPERNHMAAR